MALQLKLRVGFVFIDEDFGDERVVMGAVDVFAIGFDDLTEGKRYGFSFAVVSVYLTGAFDVLNLFGIVVFLGLVVVETVGVLVPGGYVDLYAESGGSTMGHAAGSCF